MSCLTCGAKETAYLLGDGYGICRPCFEKIRTITTIEVDPIDFYVPDNTKRKRRAYLAAACFTFGVVTAALIAWLGGEF